jgi:UDP-N-acetylglucosamine--N-acetylmuramyl-(pentapeptide) pyrophosphoryl-undecaprenol N-acetylglucosamine transferase
LTDSSKRLLIAASGTGGHLFPAIATAEKLSDYEIEWLGVPNRLETKLVPQHYPLHTIAVEGFQQRFGLGTLKIFGRLLGSVLQVRQLLQQGQFQGVLTTGGYIAAPALIAAKTLGLPTILHESNALPGKVTRWLSPWCSAVGLGFEAAATYLPRARKVCVGTPVRSQFRDRLESNSPADDLDIPEDAPLIVVVGGSQGAVAVNKLVRQCAPVWVEAGAWVVHLTGENDPDAFSLSLPHYIALPFYDNMAWLLQRADLAISRAGAGTLTELAITNTPTLLIPFPFAAEDHQTHNAAIFAAAGAAIVCRQADLTPQILQEKVLGLLRSPEQLERMSDAAGRLAIVDSAERLADLVRDVLNGKQPLR